MRKLTFSETIEQDSFIEFSKYRAVDINISNLKNCTIWIEDNVIDFESKNGEIRRMMFDNKSLKKLLLIISTYLSQD